MEKNRDAIKVLAEAALKDIEATKHKEFLQTSPSWSGWMTFLEWAGLSVE